MFFDEVSVVIETIYEDGKREYDEIKEFKSFIEFL
jgi:hypothetical protein